MGDLVNKPDVLLKHEPTDAEIIEWQERQLTLHRTIELGYMVDHYEVAILHDGGYIKDALWQGATLRDAFAQAMQAWDMTHGNTNLLEQRTLEGDTNV